MRLAIRQAGALPSLTALLGTDAEGVDKLAMEVLSHLQLSDDASAEKLANSGGIALLCESVGGKSPSASRRQAAQTLATLSAAATSAVAIAVVADAASVPTSNVAADRPDRSAIARSIVSVLSAPAWIVTLAVLASNSLTPLNSLFAMTASICDFSSVTSA